MTEVDDNIERNTTKTLGELYMVIEHKQQYAGSAVLLFQHEYRKPTLEQATTATVWIDSVLRRRTRNKQSGPTNIQTSCLYNVKEKPSISHDTG